MANKGGFNGEERGSESSLSNMANMTVLFNFLTTVILILAYRHLTGITFLIQFYICFIYFVYTHGFRVQPQNCLLNFRQGKNPM